MQVLQFITKLLLRQVNDLLLGLRIDRSSSLIQDEVKLQRQLAHVLQGIASFEELTGYVDRIEGCAMEILQSGLSGKVLVQIVQRIIFQGVGGAGISHWIALLIGSEVFSRCRSGRHLLRRWRYGWLRLRSL